MKETIRKEKGITLIALVITIIVLLILAGVAISMLSGENGILQQAARAKAQTDERSRRENIQVAALGAMINKDHKIDEEKLKEEVKKVLGENVETIPDGRNGYIIEENGKTIGIIDENGQVGEGKWHFSIEKGKELIITDGETELEIGDEINYDCTRDENGIQVTSGYTSKGDVNGYGADYTYNAKDYTGKWGILGVENGKILIMPMQNVQTNTKSTSLYMKGQEGYKNVEDELNKISEIYKYGKGADGARGIKVDDVNKVTGYNPNNIGVRDVSKTGVGNINCYGKIYEYGNKIVYYWKGDKYPYYIAHNKLSGSLSYEHSSFSWYDNNSKEWKKVPQSTIAQNTEEKRERIIELVMNYYSYYPETLTDPRGDSQSIGVSQSSKAYTMLFGNTSDSNYYYWLASLYIRPEDDSVYYGIRGVWEGLVAGTDIAFSDDTDSSVEYGVRPVVSLKSDVQLTKKDNLWIIH